MEGSTQRRQYTEAANLASPITSLPGISWKLFIRDLKKDTVDQVWLNVNEVGTVTNEEHMKCPRSSEPKSAREKRFASPSWEALRVSGNHVYVLDLNYAAVFPDKIPAELSA